MSVPDNIHPLACCVELIETVHDDEEAKARNAIASAFNSGHLKSGWRAVWQVLHLTDLMNVMTEGPPQNTLLRHSAAALIPFYLE